MPNRHDKGWADGIMFLRGPDTVLANSIGVQKMSKSQSASERSGSEALARPLDGAVGEATAQATADDQQALVDKAISTELAPAVAIALLAKSDHAPDSPVPALECLAAGVSAADDQDKVRVQLMFENGAILPVEMSREAGEALTNGLVTELQQPTPGPA